MVENEARPAPNEITSLTSFALQNEALSKDMEAMIKRCPN